LAPRAAIFTVMVKVLPPAPTDPVVGLTDSHIGLEVTLPTVKGIVPPAGTPLASIVIVDVTLEPPRVPVRLMTGLFPPPMVADRVGEAVTVKVTGITRVFEDPVVFTVQDPLYGLLAVVRPVALYETVKVAGVVLVFAEHVNQLADGVVTTVNGRLAGGDVRLTVAGCGVV